MNKETPVKIQLLTENDLTEAMRLIEPANWNHFHTGFGIQSSAYLRAITNPERPREVQAL